MDWFSELASKRFQTTVATNASTEKSRAMWSSLKNLLQAWCNIYRQQYPGQPGGEEVVLETPAAQPNQVAVRRRKVPVPPQGGGAAPPPEEISDVRISYNDVAAITAIYSTGHTPATFVLSLDAENYAAIIYDGRPIPLDRASEIALRPIFFPDVHE